MPGGQGQRIDADAVPSSARPGPGDVAAAIRDVQLNATRSFSAWLAGLFAIFVATDLLLFTSPTDRVLAAYDAALAVLFLALCLLLRGKRVPQAHAHAVAGGLMMSILPYLLTVLWLSGQPLQSTGMALWQVGLGLFLLSWPWIVALLLASDLAWIAVVRELPPSADWGHYGVLLFSANVLAAVAHSVRLRTYRRLEALRLQDRDRKQVLEAALVQARELSKVRQLSEMKTRFMNVAAHELATPMTPILIQMRLLRDLQGRMPAEARPRMDSLDRNLGRLNGLLRDILDGSRLQAEKLTMVMAPVDLRPILLDSVDAYLPVAREQGVELVLDAPAPLPLLGDPARLSQVVTNLLSNAVKFTSSGGRIEVRVLREGAGLRVEVKDDGAGFDPGLAPLLFQPFSQLHEPDGKRRGTGLGLYICKGIVERHGGRIGAESAGPGQGARFWFTLPLAA